jgi:hypothetical protein
VNRRNFLRTGAALLVAGPQSLRNTRLSLSPEPLIPVSGNVQLNQPLTVQPVQRLQFDPLVSTTLTMDAANLVVLGTLEMRPAHPDVVHTLRFINVKEQSFVGGGMDVLASDVGLWVMGDGRLELVGTSKSAWNRTGSDPSWKPDDELIVTPTGVGDTRGFLPYSPGAPLPVVNNRWTAEVLNLTRNVRIEGTSTGRSHVFIRSTQVQTIQFVQIRHMGPRKPAGRSSSDVLGRYGLHMHHCHDGLRGTVVEGVVVRDGGSHGFVPHMTNGVTIRNSIAYNLNEDGFFWDHEELSNDIVLDGCVAALIDPPVGSGGYYTVSGFNLQDGDRNTCRNCVAVGVQGAKTSSGYQWPSRGPNFGVWTFENCLAHNNASDGIYAWQNDGHDHVLTNFESYRNGKSGVEHGAYTNRYLYQGGYLYQDGWSRNTQPGPASLVLHAVSNVQGTPLSFKNMTFDGGGVTPNGVLLTKRTKPAGVATPFVECHFTGHTGTVVIVDDGRRAKGLHDFVRCTVGSERRDLEPKDFKVLSMAQGSLIRVQRAKSNSAFSINSSGQVASIQPFA